MNREIFFRGKRIDNGEWVESHSILRFSNDIYKLETLDGFITVDLSTIGQYTGKPDMDGKRAFEGDIIVPSGYRPEAATGIIRFGDNRPDTSGQNRKEIGFWVEWQGDYSQWLRDDLGYWLSQSRIVGDIYDGKGGEKIAKAN